MKDYQKANKFIEKIIKKAEKERDKKGYRENLGYDQLQKLEDYLSGLGLSYMEKAKIIYTFNSACHLL